MTGAKTGCGEGCAHGPARQPFEVMRTAGHLSGSGVLAPEVLRDLARFAGTEVTDGNAVQVLADGLDSFGAMLDLVRSSEQHLRFENFIFRADSVGRAFVTELRQRADAGVRVEVLHDPVGVLMARRLPVDLLLRGSPAEVRLFNLWLTRHRARSAGRDHRKLVVADGRSMVAGGICLADPWAGNCVRHCTWRDSAVLVEGPAALQASAAFDEVWGSSHALFDARSSVDRPAASRPGRVGDIPVRIVADLGKHRPTRRILERVIDAAERDVLITNPYPVPPPALDQALCRAASRGVAVSLLIPGRNNHFVVGLSVEHALGRLLDAGVRVFTWDGAMLHAKSVVVDGSWTLVGSSNLDPLSLDRNAELNVEIHGTAVGEAMARLFHEDCALSTPFTENDWSGRSKRRRVAARAAWSLRRWQ